MKKLRVLVWFWGRRGGGPRYTLELIKELSKHSEIELHLSLSRQSELFQESIDLELPGIHVTTYDSLATLLISSLKLPVICHKIKKYIQKNEIDIVLCSMNHIWNSVVARMIKKTKARYMLVVHDAEPHPGENNMARSFLLSEDIKQSDAVITLTNSVSKQLSQKYSYPSDRMFTIPHGVFEYFKAKKPRTISCEKPISLLFFGRILSYKGLDILLEAFQELKKKFPLLVLEIVGDGNIQPYKSRLSGLRGVNLTNRWIQESEIEGIFKNSDLCVLPYREASQSGVIPIAYAAGMPVVVTPVSGLKEQVIDGETGLVTKGVGSRYLVDSIENLIKNPNVYKKLSSGAISTAKTDLGWENISVRVSKALNLVSNMMHRE